VAGLSTPGTDPDADRDPATPGFVRVLGRTDVIALAFGAMIGWGWVVLAGDWILRAGSGGALLAFALGGLVVLLIGLTYAELAAAMPLAGGEHVYSERALGRTASFVTTWAIILGYVSVVAFEAVALPTVLALLFPIMDAPPLWHVAGWPVTGPWLIVGMAGALLVTLVNVTGVRVAARLQTLVVTLIFTAGAALFGGAVAVGELDHLAPLMRDGVPGVLAVLVMVPFLFVGFDVIPQAAEEIDLPRRSIGGLLLLSVVLAAGFYMVVVLGVGLALPSAALEDADLVTAQAAEVLFGEAGRVFLLCAGLAGILTSWNGFLLGGSRAVYALARAGLLPAFLGRLSPRFRTPVNAILMIGALSLLAPLFGRPVLVWLVDAGGVGIVLAYLMVALSFIVLRRREPALPRPFRVPFGQPLAVLALVLAAGLLCLYLPGSPAALRWPEEWLIVIAWCGLGGVLFALRGRGQPSPQATEASADDGGVEVAADA
jgi:amino acid transporter